MLFRRLLLVLPALVFAGCGHSLSELPGFDAAAWRSDRFACQNKRAALLPALEKSRDQLYDSRTSDIDGILGHPDEEELADQNQRVYTYYVEPGPQCEPAHLHSSARKFTLRFSATGTVIEVQYLR
ncbi:MULTISPECIES: hypothetical protein [Hymenobacter]|uniref:Lipoprotein n=1 Tax=Hymenobacter jejuensis TaxID=2502781 RepID=A0A5B8A3W4_9BACT|nr:MULTISPECIES: hypothetical protein [Hymenobacter]MBC6990036.1 hypothetical protein [Hymenobacter sp. BT491]QDA62064.1 hypothetical protein FHG12_19030 [Hymenobacter jejuensis]